MRRQLKLYFGKAIPLNDKVSIRQPTVNEIVDMGDDVFSKLTLPFTINLELIFDDNIDTSKLNIFELFFEENKETGGYILDNVLGGNSIELLVDSLSFFTGCDVENIRVLKNRRKIIIDDSYMIDKLSFIDVKNIIQAVCVKSDIEIEKPPKKMNKRQRDIWEKLQEGRRRKAMRESVKMEDMANYISFGGKSYIPMENILSMTYYQFFNAYNSVLGKDAYETGMAYKLSQKYDVKDEIRHWTKTLKINSKLD